MDATTTFVADVTVALIAGSIAGAASRAARVTPIVGYLAAGIVIGPFTPGYIAHGANLSGLAELGLIFLLFSLGLGFSLRELREGGVAAVLGNLAAMAACAAVVWFAAARFGVVHPLTLGLAFAVSSTAVGVTLLQTLGVLARRPGHLAIGVLIVQDLVAVLILVITSTPASQLTIAGLMLPLARAAIFVAFALTLGATVLHRVFTLALRRAGRDLLVVIFSAVALAAAWLGHLAGLTFEFGAFVAGAVTSEAAGSIMVQNVVRPFRELFVMLFFVSMGTLVDVSSIVANWRIVAFIALVAIAARLLLWFGAGRAVKLANPAALAFSIALLPMGEFNIVLGNASFAAGRLNRAEIAILVGAGMITILVSALAASLGRGKLSRFESDCAESSQARVSDVTIVGYGRVGQTVATMLVERDVRVVVVEHDAELVRLAQRAGLAATFGDGGDPDVLESVVSNETKVVLTSIPDTAANAAIVRWARARNIEAVVARAARLEEIPRLVDAGALAALVPEIEGARAFGAAVLRALEESAAP